MQNPVNYSVGVACLSAMALACIACVSVARAGSYSIVYEGEGGTQGLLAVDLANNLYGEAGAISGAGGEGSVFELPSASGYSRERELYVFGNGGTADGNDPMGGVTLTRHNVILGTTQAGGTSGDGTIFNLGTPRDIAFTALHAFSGIATKPRDGAAPQSGLTLGAFNHYYGTTTAGGLKNSGTLFSVSFSTSNPKYRILHSFGTPGDGINPQSGRLASDGQGRLFGATSGGGAYGSGTVFIEQETSAGWQEQIIFSFGENGAALSLSAPRGNVALDNKGNVYGCARAGLKDNGGVFRLTPPAQAGGVWQETVLYNFGEAPSDPIYGGMCGIAVDPVTDVIVGTTQNGGITHFGTIFELTPPAAGKTAWTEAVIHSFSGGTDGAYPRSPPLQVGDTYYGGNSANGAIYAVTP
jgi:hypothetical protein